VSSDACSCSSTDIDAEVEAVGMVEDLEYPLGTLRKVDEFVRGFGVEHGEAINMGKGHDHDVARGVGVGVQADVTILPAQD